LFADQMHAKAFVADLEQALAGGQIIPKSVALIAQPFTAPGTVAGWMTRAGAISWMPVAARSPSHSAAPITRFGTT
jgi:hypothetical protein